MPCFDPKKAFTIGINPENGKKILKITGNGTDHVEYCGQTDDNGAPLWVASPVNVAGAQSIKVVRDFIEVPCGSCPGCRADYAKHWASRCALELQSHEEAFFITLTFDQPPFVNDAINPYTGEFIQFQNLSKKVLQKFFKRLRKALSNKGLPDIRYFACGEYSPSMRPHYHAIVFGLHLDDLVFYRYSDSGNPIYTSEFLQKVWSGGRDKSNIRGYAYVASVSSRSCNYVAGYVSKKLYGFDRDRFEQLNLSPEFTLMSRKPGLGYDYLMHLLENGYDFSEFSELKLKCGDDYMSLILDPFLLSKIELYDPGMYVRLKEKRSMIRDITRDQILSQTDLDYYKYLEHARIAYEHKNKSIRKEV